MIKIEENTIETYDSKLHRIFHEAANYAYEQTLELISVIVIT